VLRRENYVIYDTAGASRSIVTATGPSPLIGRIVMLTWRGYE
jgi:hypothetical protein